MDDKKLKVDSKSPQMMILNSETLHYCCTRETNPNPMQAFFKGLIWLLVKKTYKEDIQQLCHINNVKSDI